MIIVSAPVQKIGFFGFLRVSGPVGTGDWGLGLGLDNKGELDLAFNNVKPKDRYFVLD